MPMSPEEKRAYQREWISRNKDSVRENARARSRARRDADPEGVRAHERDKAKRWRDTHREHRSEEWSARRRAATLAAYGLTVEDYDRMLLEQGSACAICRSADPGHWSGQFVVDHEHATGQVRGLLCSPCNTGLGLFGDDAERLWSAMAYLLRGSDITLDVPTAGYFRAS